MDFSSRSIFGASVSADLPNVADLDINNGGTNKDYDNEYSSSNKSEVIPDSSFIDVLNLLTKFGVPSTEIRFVGVVDPRLELHGKASVRYGYALGGGYSAKVIRHSTTEDIYQDIEDDPIVKAGTVVALKKISVKPASAGEDEQRRICEAFSTICREIRTCHHPVLSQHENISKILYLGWEQGVLFPSIALELASFGTLEDVLTAPGEGPSYRQKLNLSVDITLGIAALHHVDIVHGDIKPANILIHHHSERQVIAKISDFGGCLDLSTPQEAPAIGTDLWRAPEVIAGNPGIHWKRADTWTYGLVIASIWNHTPSPDKLLSSCYLDKIIPADLEHKAKNDYLLLLKTEPTSSTASIASCCATSIPAIDWIFRHTLSSQWSVRKDMESLAAESLTALCLEAGRTFITPFNYPFKSVDGPASFRVWSEDHRSRSSDYQALVYKHLLESACGLQVQPQPQPPQIYLKDQAKGSDEALSMGTECLTMSSPNFDEVLDSNHATHLLEIMRHIEDGHGSQARLAFNIAMSHCFELGTQLDESELVKWLYIAAQRGHAHALWMAPLIQSSYECPEHQHLRDLCLVVGACIGSKPSLSVLRTQEPKLYKATLTAIQQRSRPDLNEDGSIWMFMDFLHSPLLDPCTFELMDALRTHNVDRARVLLNDDSTDASIVDDAGRGVLHALTLLEDEKAEDLAKLCCVRGANLSLSATDNERTESWLLGSSTEGTPIYWAAAKGMTLLFRALLLLHVGTGTIIEHAYRITMLVASRHHHCILAALLEQQKQTPHLFLQEIYISDSQSFEFVPGSEEYTQTLLGMSLTRMGTFPLYRRIFHGSNADIAQKSTVELVLDQGGDPLHLPCPGLADLGAEDIYSAFSSVLIADDVSAAAILASNIDRSGLNANDLEVLSQSLQLCMYNKSGRCFELLVNTFPQLLNFGESGSFFSELSTLTPLNAAARQSDPTYARVLLERGADISIWHNNFSPLARAVTDGHPQTAEVIYEYCSEAERQRDFGPNERTGFTLMGRVMSVWCTGKKSQSLISVMQWIRNKGGATFIGNVRDDVPLWCEILKRRPSTTAEDSRLDDRMLEALFDMFPDKLNQPDSSGYFPIHWATLNGHKRAIELLLQRGADLNAETTSAHFRGRTAFDLIVLRLNMNTPPDVLRGGKVELRRWRERLRDLLHFFVSKGTGCGSGTSFHDKILAFQYQACNVSVVRDDDVDQDDESGWDKDVWPQKLPSDETSSEENRRQGGELMTPRTKQNLRVISGPLNRANANEQREDIYKEMREEYELWLAGRAKSRREQYKTHGASFDLTMCDPNPMDSQDFNPAWIRWHKTLISGYNRRSYQNEPLDSSDAPRATV